MIQITSIQQAIPLKVKRLEPAAKLPAYGSEGAACFDLHAYMGSNPVESFVMDAHSIAAVHTGLSVEVPSGYSMDIRSRSGNFVKNGIVVFPGTIDSDYRGEVMVLLTNTTDKPFTVKNGDRIAQALLTVVPKVAFIEATELSETERGVGGFGSTGI